MRSESCYREQSDAVFALGEEVIVLPGMRVGRGRDDSSQGVKEGIDLSCVLGDAILGVSGINNDRAPEINRSDSRFRMWTPQPAEAVASEADPKVKIEAIGFGNGGWPREATTSYAFVLVLNRFTLLWMPMVCILPQCINPRDMP